MILNLVNGKDPILSEVMPRFVFDGIIDTAQLSRDLAETMISNKGLGLAANQVGLRHRVCVITGESIRAMFNPKIVDSSEEQSYMTEGCLSYPGLKVKIKRPLTIKVRYTQPDGQTVTEEFGGLTAKIVAHEIDHLNGITILQRANQFHLESALRKLKNSKK